MQELRKETNINICILNKDNPLALWDLAQKLGVIKDRDYFENALDRQIKGELEVIIASIDNNNAGFCFLNWGPKYTYFKLHNIPEIQDLNVLQNFRNQGIGAAIIRYCEGLAIGRKYSEMGIGVGLDRSFGPAQRLYVKLGYVPDGNGISYDRKQVLVGEFKAIDENLCLMMTKALK